MNLTRKKLEQMADLGETTECQEMSINSYSEKIEYIRFMEEHGHKIIRKLLKLQAQQERSNG